MADCLELFLPPGVVRLSHWETTAWMQEVEQRMEQLPRPQPAFLTGRFGANASL